MVAATKILEYARLGYEPAEKAWPRGVGGSPAARIWKFGDWGMSNLGIEEFGGRFSGSLAYLRTYAGFSGSRGFCFSGLVGGTYGTRGLSVLGLKESSVSDVRIQHQIQHQIQHMQLWEMQTRHRLPGGLLPVTRQ